MSGSRYWNQSRNKYVNYDRNDPNHPHNKAVEFVCNVLSEYHYLTSTEIKFVPKSKAKLLRYPMRLDILAISPDNKIVLDIEVDGGYNDNSIIQMNKTKNRNEDIKEAMPYVNCFLHIKPEDAMIRHYLIEQIEKAIANKK